MCVDGSIDTSDSHSTSRQRRVRSWLNAVEGFFAKLTKRRLKRGVFGRRSAGRHQSLRRRTLYQAEALHLDR
jgi:hypothetical protein